MNKEKLILRAKSYLDMLSKGIDPISGNEVPGDSVLSQERLQNCFSFLAELLEEALGNHRLISLPDSESAGFELVRRKAAFSIQAIPRQEIPISETPLSTSAFVKSINTAVDVDGMEKLSLTDMNRWLKKKGFLSETKELRMTNRTVRHITQDANRIGILERETVDAKTGELVSEIVLSRQAQEFILAHYGE